MMSVRSVAIARVRERLPQLLQQARDRLGRLPLKRPGWPAQAAVAHWISWRMVAAAVLLGGIVHIWAVLAASGGPSGTAYQLLVDQLPVNRMIVLPQQVPGHQILPELPPDTLYAMCRYDLHEGPVVVRATVLGPGWSLSVHTPQGGNFYVLPGQASRSTDVSFLLVPSAPEAAGAQPRREGAADTQIASPSMEGLVVLRAPIRGLAWTAETEAVLKRASCAQVKQ